MIIREEEPAELKSVYHVVKSAFPKPDEAELVNRLRENGDAVISLVASDGDQIVGHVLLSRMEAPFKALGLGPVSVLPESQRKGIGSTLIIEAIKRAKEAGWEGIFVLGDPDYYGRFGFDVGLAAGFSCTYAGSHFMALPLKGELPARKGNVAYAPAFASLG